MKKHNTVKVVLITMLVFLLLSWIIPAAIYSGQYVEQGRVQMGLFDLLNYPFTALSYFGYIALYIILVGGFYGVLYKIPAYRSFLDKIVNMFKGKEKIFLSVVVAIIALIVSICGLQFGLFLFVPFIVAIVLLMGYDKIVAALVTAGSMAVGLMGSTYATQNVGMLTTALGLDFDFQIGVRFIILLLGVILVIFNTLMYIKKSMLDVKIEKKTIKKVEEEKVEKVVATKKNSTSKKTTNSKKNSTTDKKKNSSKSKSTVKSSKSRKSDNKAALKDEDIIVVKESVSSDLELVPESVDTKHSVWPFVVTFALLLILMILAFVSWGEGGFGVSLFEDVTKSVTEFKLFTFPIFGKLLGTINAFGSWTIMDLLLPIMLVMLFLVFIYKIKIDDMFDGFAEGAKKALAPAFMVILIYSMLVLVTYHPFQLVIYKSVLGLSKGFNIATTTLVAILSGLFNSDASYVFQSVLPYFTSVVTNTDNYAIAGIIFQSMYGLVMLIAPTSVVLMVTLSYLNVSYKEWLKRIWKLLLELFVILLIVFIILAVI